jgi:hypothetical protein
MRRGSGLLSVGRGKAIFPLEVLTLSGNFFGGEEQHGCSVVFGEAETQLSLEGSYPSIIFVFFLEGQQGYCVVLGEDDENATQLPLEGSYAAAVYVGESLW